MQSASAEDMEIILAYSFALVEECKNREVDLIEEEPLNEATFYVMSKNSALGFDATRKIIVAVDGHVSAKRWNKKNYSKVYTEFVAFMLKKSKV